MSGSNVNVFALEYARETTFRVAATTGFQRVRVTAKPTARLTLEQAGASETAYALSNAASVRGAKGGSLTFRVALRAGDGYEGELCDLFELAGMKAATSENEALSGLDVLATVREPEDLVNLPTATFRLTTPGTTLTLTGCALNFRIVGGAGGLAEVEFTATCDGYEVGAEVSPQSLAASSETALRALGALVRYEGESLACASLEFARGLNLQEQKDVGATNGRAGFFAADSSSMRLAATLYHHTTKFGHGEVATTRDVLVRFGGETGARVVVWVPKADVRFERAEEGGLLAMKLAAVPTYAPSEAGDVLIGIA